MGLSKSVQDWKNAGEMIRFGDFTVFLRDEGQGTPLLLIHGFPTSSWDWCKVWPELVAEYRLIAPDMLGFGFTDKPAGHRYSLIEQADLHVAVCEALDINECHVLAHDYGVSVAQELLARQEEGRLGFKIHSIAFLNGGLFPETHHARLIQKLLLGPIGPVLSRLMGYKQFAKSFSAVFGADTQPSEQELSDFWALICLQQGNRQLHRLMRYIIDRRENRERWLQPLQNTAVPLCVINGPEDPVSGRHMVERYRELVPNPRDYLLDGIGHYPQVEDKNGVLMAYSKFRSSI